MLVLGHLRNSIGSVSSAVREGNLLNDLRSTLGTIHSTDDMDSERDAMVTFDSLAVTIKYWKCKCMRSMECETM